jgi:hypothetical protein
VIIHTSYQEFQKRLMPSQWKYLPRTLDICALEPFAKVLDAEPNVVVTATDFEDAFWQLPELLLASSDARKIHLRSLLQTQTSANQPSSSFSGEELGKNVQSQVPPPSSSSSSQPDALDLATTVFTCREGCSAPFLFGWDNIAQHHCNLDLDKFDTGGPSSYWQYDIDRAIDPPRIYLSVDRSKIAATIVRAAGLDDRVATVSDMDAKDLRFGCSACHLKRHGASSWTNVGYKWHDFVRFLPLDYSFALFFFRW